MRSWFIPVLLAGMLITGSSNSLWSKWQDMQCVENCEDSDPRRRVLYEQPVWQTLQMFAGEMLCFLPVWFSWIRSKVAKPSPSIQLDATADEEQEAITPSKLAPAPQPLTGWKILLLWIPALCDLTGTTLMNVGLLYTPVSIYQMTRGSLVGFVAILSVVFLRHRLWLYQWISLLIVIIGVALVGLSGSMIKDTIKEVTTVIRTMTAPEPTEVPQATTVLVGILFVLFAQIFTATQFVVEEKILGRYSVAPLVAVGWEGFFGTVTILLFIPILALPSVSAKTPFFDIPRGWHQMIDNPPVLWSGVAIAISISMFNYFGLSVTRHVSATARSLTDTCRTLTIWIISLGLGWEKLLFPLSLLQVLGFSLLVYGTFLYNNLVSAPAFLPKPTEDSIASEEAQGLLSDTLDETARLPSDMGRGGFDVTPAEGGQAQASR